MLVGFFEFLKGNIFGFIVFISYGVFWILFVLFKVFFFEGVSYDFVGWYLIVWGIFILMMFIGIFVKVCVL